MIDHLLGRPSAAYKRTQVFLVLLFWTASILTGNKNGPPIVRWFSKKFRARLTPWQVLAGTLTCLYAIKNVDSILGLEAPEPLARLYSRDFYRATWMVTALDAGFATGMHIKPKWLRDVMSILFSGYYLLFAQSADEKLRKYRAVCTVEMLRATWEKTGNPLIRAATARERPSLITKKRILLPRPHGSPYSKPIIAHLYYNGTESQLAFQRDLILDCPGGGFVCMAPLHHEERLHHWTIKTGKPLLAIEYSKAPEFPYPYALHECFDVFRLLHETKGSIIGMKQGEVRIVLTGDSAGANIGAAVMIKILETPEKQRLPLPIAVIWTYPALDFNFTSFMPPEHLRILRHESSAMLKGVTEQKDHMNHKSPLSVVEDDVPQSRRRRKQSWSKSFSKLPGLIGSLKSPNGSPAVGKPKHLPIPGQFTGANGAHAEHGAEADKGAEADHEGEGEADEEKWPMQEWEKPISERVQYWNPDRAYDELDQDATSPVKPAEGGKRDRAAKKASTLGTRLTMTSRTGFFNDRIIVPSMMRAMAICYVGPRNSPDLSKNYYISPIMTPAPLLAQFPPVYLLCGERDPFSDDSLIFAGRLRDAKLARKAEAQAKANKFGEGLRMSSSLAANRDSILDESEEDWVTMRFIEGWSHGFMQMVTLLPKVRHFFDLTADWAELSFARAELAARHAAPVGMQSPVPAPVQDSTSSEKEDEVLSFKPRRRASRASSPAPASFRNAANAAHKDGTAPSATSPLSSSSNSDSGSTAPTSVQSLPERSPILAPVKGGTKLQRRPSPTTSGRQGVSAVQRLLEEEVESSPARPASAPSEPRRGSAGPAAESAVAAAAFVEAHDLLKRRREDAVFSLGSALVTDEDDVHASPTSPRSLKEKMQDEVRQRRASSDR